MKKGFLSITVLLGFFILLGRPSALNAQTLEWRLINPMYMAADPDGAGPATGSSMFTLQIHTVSGTVNSVNAVSVGWSYQSAKAMIPSTPGCAVVSNPANVTVSPAFVAGGFAYTVVNQCGVFTQTAGGQTFDRRVVGTLDGSSINITTTWIDVFTVTLWTLGNTSPQGGYIIINSGSGGTPGAFPTYAVADIAANEYVVNSLTYTTPLALSSGPLPVALSNFDVTCTDKGARIRWQTATESNSDHFEIEKSNNENSGWNMVASTKAAGSSTAVKQYEFTDAQNGSAAFYRLRQVDRDGKFTYSSTVKSSCEGKMPELMLYPIPARNRLTIVFQSEKNIKVTIKLVDMAGRVYQDFQRDVLKGENKIGMDVSRLSAGQYILSVGASDKVQYKKVIIE